MKRKCFIVCPIGAEGSSTRKHSDKLFKNILKPLLDELGFESIRLDLLPHNELIHTKLHEYLNSSELVISDLTNSNPNVLYEVGYRNGINKYQILIKYSQDQTSNPFDISGINIINYGYDVEEAESFKEKIKSVIDTMTFENSLELTEHSQGQTNVMNKLVAIEQKIDDLLDQYDSVQALTNEQFMMKTFLDIATEDSDRLDKIISASERISKFKSTPQKVLKLKNKMQIVTRIKI